MSVGSFAAAIAALQAEVVDNPRFTLVSIPDEAVFASILLMRQHHLNATDAAILTVFLDYVRGMPAGSPPSVLVAADQRLVRAAESEGLATLNPELLRVDDGPPFLAAL